MNYLAYQLNQGEIEVILLNKGLTDAESAKISSPYAANCGEDSYDLEAVGIAAGSFIDRHQDTFMAVMSLLNNPQSH